MDDQSDSAFTLQDTKVSPYMYGQVEMRMNNL